MNLRGAKPVVDYSVQTFIEHLNPTTDLYNENIQQDFTEQFYNWITSSKNNTLTGIEDFKKS